MKAFRKWWESYRQKWSLNEHYAKGGWRAALKWVRENQKRLFPQHEDWQGNFIEREL